MDVRVKHEDVRSTTSDTILVGIFQDGEQLNGTASSLNESLDGAVSELIENGDINGKLGETATLYPRGAIAAKRVIIVGLGKHEDFKAEVIREASAVAIKLAKSLGATSVASALHDDDEAGIEVSQAAQAIVEGSLLALYEYEKAGASKDDESPKLSALTLIASEESNIAEIEMGVHAGEAIAEGVYLARTLVNRPSNIATPTAIAEIVQSMSADIGLNCRVLNEDEMRDEEMGLLLSVSQGSAESAKFIVIEHKPAQATNEKPVVLIGKGVSFDTGGYSLKPQAGMLGMKGDMSGAAAVIGAMNAVGKLNVPLHVVGLVPSAENMVSSTAFKPNDVFVAKNGVSVEIINTDAEGRLVLGDALAYADQLNPELVIDVATLTGAKKVALGSRINALYATEDSLNDELIAAGRNVNEPLWRMPLDESYDAQLKSAVADIKNDGGPEAASVTAARFLARFVGDWPWAHIDIAGSHYYSSGPEQDSRSYMTPGASGTPMRVLVEFLRQRAEQN